MSHSHPDIEINREIEPQIESEMDSDKKAEAYDPVVAQADNEDLEKGRVKEFFAGQHQDVIPDSVDPNFVQVEQVRRGLSQRHIQVSDTCSPSYGCSC